MSRFTSILSTVAICLSIVALVIAIIQPSPLIRNESGGTQWRLIAEFSGSGNQETRSFHVSSDEWKILWEAQVEEIAHGLTIEILSSNTKEELDSFHQRGESGEFKLHSGHGFFLLRILSPTAWNITIYEWS